jgi:CheY-like chemotaxis protein
VPTVSVVEDDDDAAEPLVHALRREGYTAVHSPNGREAVAALVFGGVDLVITDLRMPEMDRVTFLTVLRSYLRFQSLPVIVFSAYAEGRNAERVGGLTVSDVFRKGTSGLTDVVQAVNRHLRS